VENGIVLTGGSSTVKGNYIHDLQVAGSDPHYDGISVQGGQRGVLIEGNSILSRDTSNIIINNDFGPVFDVTVHHNYLAGSPGWNIYVYGTKGGTTGVVITENYIERAYYGYYSVEASSPVISNNIEVPPRKSASLSEHRSSTTGGATGAP
jgi:hypothetical protein